MSTSSIEMSLIHIYELSPVHNSDLDNDYAEIMADALSSYGKHDKAEKAQQIERAIRARNDSLPGSPARSRRPFVTSPSPNASRFCRKPKDRTTNGTESPSHSNSHRNHRNEYPSQLSISSTTARGTLPVLPMDRFSSKLFNPPDKQQTLVGGISPRNGLIPFHGNPYSCFGGRPRPTNDFTIHPDWVSESLFVQKVPLTDRETDITDKVKRSQSAPPPLRNIITWEHRSDPTREPSH